MDYLHQIATRRKMEVFNDGIEAVVKGRGFSTLKRSSSADSQCNQMVKKLNEKIKRVALNVILIFFINQRQW